MFAPRARVFAGVPVDGWVQETWHHWFTTPPLSPVSSVTAAEAPWYMCTPTTQDACS